MNSYLTKLEQSLGVRYSENTVKAFVGQARRFVAAVGEKSGYDKQDILRYTDMLVKAGYKEDSILTILSGVRALFHANGWAWPLARRDLHLGLPQEDPGGPVMPHEDIARLIAAAKGLAAPEAPAIAMSTLYGLRAAEIAMVLAAGCDGRTLAVQTAKAGRRRSHYVPHVAHAALRFTGRPITVDGVHTLFGRVMARHVRPHARGEGWHSIRRALITELSGRGLGEAQIHRWFGWRVAPGGSKIAFRYYRPEGQKLDDEVYALHPYLPLWR